MSLKMFQADFEKFSLSPGVLTQKNLFGWKMAFWAFIFETVHQILMIFSQILDIVLNDLASVLCAKKFSFAPPQGGIYPRKGPLLAKMA